jgi:dolichol-phosphate mannosyltransferase
VNNLSSICATLPAELSIVTPTFNEAANVEHVVAALSGALPDVNWEVIFVDDNSPDGTSDRVREIARRDQRVRILHRFGRRGLSSACVEGIMASSAP